MFLCGQQGGQNSGHVGRGCEPGREAPAVRAAQLEGPCWLTAASCSCIPRVLLLRLSVHLVSLRPTGLLGWLRG